METKKKLMRSRDRMIAGVCGGLAEYFGIDPTIVRIAYALLSIISVGFPGFVMYLILMLIMPKANDY